MWRRYIPGGRANATLSSDGHLKGPASTGTSEKVVSQPRRVATEENHSKELELIMMDKALASGRSEV